MDGPSGCRPCSNIAFPRAALLNPRRAGEEGEGGLIHRVTTWGGQLGSGPESISIQISSNSLCANLILQGHFHPVSQYCWATEEEEGFAIENFCVWGTGGGGEGARCSGGQIPGESTLRGCPEKTLRSSSSSAAAAVRWSVRLGAAAGTGASKSEHLFAKEGDRQVCLRISAAE